MENSHQIYCIESTNGSYSKKSQIRQNKGHKQSSKYSGSVQLNNRILEQLERRKESAKNRLEDSQKHLSRFPNDEVVKRTVKNNEEELYSIDLEIRKLMLANINSRI